MKIEIAIEGPREALLILLQRAEGGAWRPENQFERMEDSGERSRIIFIQEEAGLDHALSRLSRIVTNLERTLFPENTFQFRTKNLAYAEPKGAGRRGGLYSPIPSLEIQSWDPSLKPTTDLDGIILDSKNAFGTGGHPTTRLCLECLETLAGNKTQDWGLEGREVLDFGCGTGLLAIAAVKMGASRAMGVDIVQDAARTAERNVRLNGLTDKIIIRWGDWNQVHGRYDLILANLVASALLRSGGQISQYLKEGGRAVISGFSGKQMEDMERFFRATGLKTIYRSSLDVWGMLFMEHRSTI